MNKEKLLLYGVLVIIVFLILDKFLGLSKGWREEKEEKDTAEGGLDIKEEEQTQLQNVNILPTYPASWYYDQASIIFNSLDKFYQDENSVAQSISKIKNQADFVLLQRAFGTKQSKNLLQWVRDGLRNKDIIKLNTYLQKKGITYRF
jgi:hypothetical protein